jgi:hypothetical protein
MARRVAGQLGDGTTTDRSMPTTTDHPTLAAVVGIAF